MNAWLRPLLDMRPLWAMLLLALFAGGGSAAVALLRGIPAPSVHDEFAYILAAETFAAGRVTNPTPPLWEHFETFHVIMQPSYTSKYPPGQGLFLAAGQLLGGHPIVGVWISVGLMCAAIYWMLLAWLPRRWALLGGLLTALQFGIVDYWSQSYWGGAVAALGGALLFGSLRRIVTRPRLAEGVLLGLGLAILANSRPFEGVLVSLPAAAILGHSLLRGSRSFRRELLVRVAIPVTLILGLTGTAMGYYNWRTTGEVGRMPYTVYDQSYGITSMFYWQPPRSPAPEYRHEVFERLHRDWALAQRERVLRLDTFLALAARKVVLLLAFFMGPAAVALIYLRSVIADRWMLLTLAIPAGVTVASLSTATYPHYVAPATGLLVALMTGALREAIRRLSSNPRSTYMLPVFFSLIALGVVMRLAGASPVALGGFPAFEEQRSGIIHQLTAQPGRDLVLVRYGQAHDIHQEWVYNGPDLDAAPVVWARDMGWPENERLLEYYADRRVWSLVVDHDLTLIPLGSASQAAR